MEEKPGGPLGLSQLVISLLLDDFRQLGDLDSLCL